MIKKMNLIFAPGQEQLRITSLTFEKKKQQLKR